VNHQSDCGCVESVKCIAHVHGDLDVDLVLDLANSLALLESADQWSLLAVFFLLLPIIAQLWVWGLAFIFCFAFHFAANLATCMTPHCWRCCFLAAVGHFGIFFNWRPTCNWPMILQLRNALCRMSMIDYKSGMSRLLRSFHTFIFHIFFFNEFRLHCVLNFLLWQWFCYLSGLLSLWTANLLIYMPDCSWSFVFDLWVMPDTL